MAHIKGRTRFWSKRGDCCDWQHRWNKSNCDADCV